MKTSVISIGTACLLAFTASGNIAEITFDEVVDGAVSYAYDGDGDDIDDVLFSTTDPTGFNTAGPGQYMNFINEPGIEGTTTLETDLRADFIFGATSNISFGFALSTTQEIYGVSFELYNTSDNLIASTFQKATYTNLTTSSDFPEAILSLDFEGTAAYCLFKFDEFPPRYIIDNFIGNFGSRPDEQGAVVTDFTMAPAEGVIIEWVPVFGLDSEVKWSSSLYLPFTSISTVLPYPQSSYTDIVHSAESEGFYRVELVY